MWWYTKPQVSLPGPFNSDGREGTIVLRMSLGRAVKNRALRTTLETYPKELPKFDKPSNQSDHVKSTHCTPNQPKKTPAKRTQSNQPPPHHQPKQLKNTNKQPPGPNQTNPTPNQPPPTSATPAFRSVAVSSECNATASIFLARKERTSLRPRTSNLDGGLMRPGRWVEKGKSDLFQEFCFWCFWSSRFWNKAKAHCFAFLEKSCLKEDSFVCPPDLPSKQSKAKSPGQTSQSAARIVFFCRFWECCCFLWFFCCGFLFGVLLWYVLVWGFWFWQWFLVGCPYSYLVDFRLALCGFLRAEGELFESSRKLTSHQSTTFFLIPDTHGWGFYCSWHLDSLEI